MRSGITLRHHFPTPLPMMPFKRTWARIVVATALVATLAPALHAQRSDAPEVLFRLDDIGMNHSVNMALEEVAKTGMPFSATVLFVCPWYQEAVEILKKYPQVTVGVHLALNSEWRDYRFARDRKVGIARNALVNLDEVDAECGQ